MKVSYPIIAGSGVEIYHQRLAVGLSKFGVDSQIFKFSPLWELWPWGLPWKFRRLKPPGFVNDLIHTNAEYGCLLRERDLPLVVTLHHSSVDRNYLVSLAPALRTHHQLLLKPFVKKTLSSADRIVAVSFHTKATFCDVFQQDLQIQVIYHGIDPQVFCPIANEPPSADGPIILFFSGNPTRRKGFDLIAPVMKRLGRDFVLHYTTGLRSAAPASLSAANIKCLGFLSERELLREINRAAIAFQPSRREGFGLSILEAMACERPVVSTNCSAIPELLEHGKGGFLCEVGSVDQMVTAIRNLGHSVELRRKMGEYNRQVVLRKFTLEQMSTQYYTLYRSLLA